MQQRNKPLMRKLMTARSAGAYMTAAVAVTLLAVLGAAYLKAAPKEEGAGGALTYASRDKEKEAIAAVLAAHPSEEAYRLFKERYQGYSYDAQHVVAHIFGELLYKKEGIPGVAFCDSDFGFGCYHSFFGLAIAERGPTVAHELDEACFKKFGRLGTGCPHGIGHGLMWYLGDERLEEALSFCDGMHYEEPIGGCTSGVFMEYNDHTMATASTTALSRVFDPEDPYEPCASLSEKYRQACYFEQAAWWYRSLALDAARTGALCEGVKETNEREACLRGLGNAVGPSSGFSPEASVAACDRLGTREGRDLCKQGAAWSFLTDPSRAERATEVCNQDDQAVREMCIEHARIIK